MERPAPDIRLAGACVVRIPPFNAPANPIQRIAAPERLCRLIADVKSAPVGACSVVQRELNIMTMEKTTASAEFLELHAHSRTAGKAWPVMREVLVVEDEDSDARRLAATLRLVLGRGVHARRVETLAEVAGAVSATVPDIVFIDDYLEPGDNALDTIPELRRAGYAGPVIVLSGAMDRARSLVLQAAGARVTLHKEDVNSVTVAEALSVAFAEADGGQVRSLPS